MRIFCIGQNYAAHVREMGNAAARSDEPPVIFMKPETSLVSQGTTVPWPTHGSVLHYETELVIGIGRDGRPKDEDEAARFISGFTLGFDLTMRDVQSASRKAGLPWETAKAFDNSALCGPIVAAPLQRFLFTGKINGVLRQTGDTEDMVFPVTRLLVELGRVWTLRSGDLLFSGTPAGVGPLSPGDTLLAESAQLGRYTWRMALMEP
jgi:2-keto-4-pentenoate hydratase/2-oxohepta-3-ene-1,7-dioic acid hydratase in catechol pathway